MERHCKKIVDIRSDKRKNSFSNTLVNFEPMNLPWEPTSTELPNSGDRDLMPDILRMRLISAFLLVLIIIQPLPSSGSLVARSGLPEEITYFVGVWKVTVKGDPNSTYKWTVAPDKNGEWLEGAMEKDGVKTSTDFWRKTDTIIERFVFTTDGTLLRVTATGWKTSTLVMTGIASGKTGNSRVRETITREGEKKFHAVWERQTEDGKWTVFSDESCER